MAISCFSSYWLPSCSEERPMTESVMTIRDGNPFERGRNFSRRVWREQLDAPGDPEWDLALTEYCHSDNCQMTIRQWYCEEFSERDCTRRRFAAIFDEIGPGTVHAPNKSESCSKSKVSNDGEHSHEDHYLSSLSSHHASVKGHLHEMRHSQSPSSAHGRHLRRNMGRGRMRHRGRGHVVAKDSDSPAVTLQPEAAGTTPAA